MLRPLTYSLSALAVAIGSWHSPVNANSLSSLPLNINQENKETLVAQQNVPEVIVDTVPADGTESSGQSDVVVDSDSSNTTPTPTANGRRFTCEQYNGQYTVMYNPQNQSNRSYPWAIPQQMGGNWSPQRRCEAISQRLESYRPDGLLELQTSVKNGENIVCATTQANPSCRIVFTVPRGQDPVKTRNRVFENLVQANQGQQTRGVTTFTDSSSLRDLLGGRSSSRQKDESINLRPFLAPSDGGTGTELRSNSSSSSSDLNPDWFR
ncbi:MAG: COP23 domain-containing protein [Halothece sp.]